MARSGRRPPCFVQVNTGEEPQKAGVLPDDADGFIADCRDGLDLPIDGLMCIPPADEDPAPHFALLAEIARRNGLRELSMGMSADYETAIALRRHACAGRHGDLRRARSEGIVACYFVLSSRLCRAQRQE